MKFQAISSLLFVATSFVDAASFGKNFGEPKCVLFDTIKMEGGAEFVDTDGSGIPDPFGNSIITTGDMTIGELYKGVEGYGVPTQYASPFSSTPILEEIEIAYKSVCIVTKDQIPPSDTSSPTCFYEFELGFCPRGEKCREGRFTAHGSGPKSLQITGGSGSFFGAYGEIVTPSDFYIDPSDVNPDTGDLGTTSIDMDIQLCFYDRKGSFL